MGDEMNQSNPASLAPLTGGKLALATLAVALATFMNVLDSSIANVAIPTIAGNLGVSVDEGTWVITLFAAAGSATAATFTVTNTLVAATDTIVLSVKSSTNVYLVHVTAVAAGSFNITFFTTGGTSSDSPVINFTVIKGAAS